MRTVSMSYKRIRRILSQSAVTVVPITLGVLICTGTAPAAAQGEAPANTRPGVILTFSGGASSFFEHDMDQTYGIVPSFMLRCAAPLDNGGETFIGIGYMGGTGDPYYDDEGFSGGESAVLHTMPIEIGLRGRPLRHAAAGFAMGVAVQYVRVTERIPGYAGTQDADRPEMTAWGWGVRVLALQEWRLPDTHWALGVEASTGVGMSPVDDNDTANRVNLAGVDLRGSVSYMP
jgi:hypothetical protein